MHHSNGNRRPVSYSGLSNHDWEHEDRQYHQGLTSSNYSADEFTYYPDADEETRVSEYHYHSSSSYVRPSPPSVPSFSNLTRASSSDSLDYPFQANYDPRNINQPPMSGQSMYANQQSKCRQLPCRTFISTGSCPYGDRCVFLHDPSIVSKPIYIRSKRKSKDDTGVDAFFWPTMPWSAVMGRVDMKNMPLISQPYIVPAPNSYSTSTSNNDVAVYSMWEHFLDFCKEDPLSIVTVPRKVPLLNPYAHNNIYTGKRRLPVFIRLSQYNCNHYG